MAMINISIKQVDSAENRVEFFAPVFVGIEYKIAKPVGDYVSHFEAMMPNDPADDIFFSCSCVLNSIHADLKNRPLRGFTGPMTFGEIVYQLLNQTLAYAVIEDIENGQPHSG